MIPLGRRPAVDHSPAFAATAILRFALADVGALNAAFAVPGLEEHVERWQARYPHQVIWANTTRGPEGAVG